MNNLMQLVRLGRNAEVRKTAGGETVVGFAGAFEAGRGDRKQTLWLDCSAWGARFEKVAQYLTKGAQVLVQGELGTRTHEGKTYLTCNVRELQLCGGKAKE